MNDTDRENLERAQALIKAHPGISHFTAAVVDLNGIPRGKKVPVDQIGPAFERKLRMPLSTLGVDIWGCDTVGSKEVYETGDADGFMIPTERGLIPDLAGSTQDLFLPLWMVDDQGEAYGGDPRQALATTLKKLKNLGMRAVLATELEFYLVDAGEFPPRPPQSPETQRRHDFEHVLSVDALSEFRGFLDDVYKACELQGIPADSVISEGGPAQLEVNLRHQDDALKVADDTFFFKRIVRQAARAHGFDASFMAKTYGHEPGNGLHVHVSLVDDEGGNLFDDGSASGNALMHHAVAGLIDSLHEAFLVFAPHINSYRRFRSGSHAPDGIAWGYENRTATIRIPGGSPKSRRIEHRLAGADANPYLLLNAILGGMIEGIDKRLEPPQPIEGDAYSRDLPPFPRDWPSAIHAFGQSERMQAVFGEKLQTMYTAQKLQERDRFGEMIADFEYRTYLMSI